MTNCRRGCRDGCKNKFKDLLPLSKKFWACLFTRSVKGRTPVSRDVLGAGAGRLFWTFWSVDKFSSSGIEVTKVAAGGTESDQQDDLNPISRNVEWSLTTINYGEIVKVQLFKISRKRLGWRFFSQQDRQRTPKKFRFKDSKQ
jgi:hypothetical protein